ncbi:MAG: ABC transporter permease [Myxococcales bacterium]|jgi:peptide/nickel transport system permease protein|nr:ABC transporter permease [Myxococcales bacterium]
MSRYILRRAAFGFLVTWLVFTTVFFLMNGLGDPAAAVLGANAQESQIRQFKEQKGLDRPLHEQYLSYLGLIPCVRRDSPAWSDDPGARKHCGILQGDLGESYIHHDSVTRVIGHRLPRTLLLGVMAMVVELVFGIGAGIFAGLRPGTTGDRAVMFGTYLGTSLPTYVTGPLALLVFAYLLGWFPVGGYGATPLEHIQHGILPALVLGIGGTAVYARVMRGEVIESMRQEYVRTARAKGVPEGRVILAHGIRNSLLPAVTMIGLSLPGLVSGAIITEKIFAWPGLGALTIEAINALDAPMVLAVTLLFAVMVQIGNLLADVGVALMDPRIQY